MRRGPSGRCSSVPSGSALAAALEVPVQQVDVAAVELAIGAAVEVGVDVDEVSRARSISSRSRGARRREWQLAG